MRWGISSPPWGWTATLSPHKLYHLENAAGVRATLTSCACPPSRKSAAPGAPALRHQRLLAVVEQLNITELEVTHGALRQGLLHDLLEHEPPADKEVAGNPRPATRLWHRHRSCRARSPRCHHPVGRSLCLAEAGDTAHDALRIAALLHEVGMCVALNDYHHHAYILRHCAHAT